jgi:hypothetical protein
MQPLYYLEKQWGVLSQAPFVFLIVLALASGAAYAAARWAYQARLDAMGDRLKLKEDQLADRDRKLAELRQSVDSPPPQIEAQGDGSDYSAVIRQLVQLYIFTHNSPPPGLLAGTELPPRDWMNEQLAEMGKGWRVGTVRGPAAEICAA